MQVSRLVATICSIPKLTRSPTSYLSFIPASGCPAMFRKYSGPELEPQPVARGGRMAGLPVISLVACPPFTSNSAGTGASTDTARADEIVHYVWGLCAQ